MKRYIKNLAEVVYRNLKENGGITCDWNGNRIETGYVVATNKGTFIKTRLNRDCIEKTLIKLMDKAPIVGAWFDGNVVHFDIIMVTSDKENALDIGKRNNQIAIYDLTNKKEIFLTNLI